MNEDVNTVERAIENLERSIPSMLYRLLWLAFDEHDTLVPLGLSDENAPGAMALCEQFRRPNR